MSKTGKQSWHRKPRRAAVPRFHQKALHPPLSGGATTEEAGQDRASPDGDDLDSSEANASPRAFPEIESMPPIDADIEHVHDGGTPEQMVHERDATSMQKIPDAE
ncbi:hypothetical protein [Nevskia soli]|uniref:hypothetical protein n=1 Tax=Nevskia soli TaxID=418856 RepID=UPI0012F7DD54|nr:hypothetical protein [Nevskia soli]